MKTIKVVLALIITVGLCACSNSQAVQNNELKSNSNTESSIVSDIFQSESSIALDSNSQETSDTIDQFPPTDYYKYYDPITNQSTMIDTAEFDNGTLYMMDDNDCLKIVTPNSFEYIREIDKVKRDTPYKCFMLDNYVFYRYQIGGHNSGYTVGLKKYDLNSGELCVVVPSESLANTGVAVDRDWWDVDFVLSNDNRIYGTVLTWEKKSYVGEDGKIGIKTTSQWNLVRINDSYDGYTIVKTFDSEYNYYIRAVYDNIAYLSKSELDRSERLIGGGFGTISGEELGLYSYDEKKGVEEKVFDTYEIPSGVDSKCSVIEINEEPYFIYYNYNDIYLYTQAGGWKNIFSSTNNIAKVQLVNNKIYVFLYTGGNLHDYICYEVTPDSSEYLGICEAGRIVYFDSIMGKTRFIDSQGNLKDFI